jgi:hypothetical protein
MNDIDVTLANDPTVGRIQLCGCRCIHLSIGPVTINLAPEAFVQAAILVRTAMEQLSKLMDESRTDLPSNPKAPAGQIH